MLIPVDSIEWDNTLIAVENAIEFSKGCRVEGEPELIFLHVFQSKDRVPMSEKDRIKKMKEKKMEDEFETIGEMCEEKGVTNYRTMVKEGEPHEKILETAKNEDVGMIIMGSGKLHDRSAKGRIQKFVYGSVTEKVLHQAPSSVLVARPKSSLSEKTDEEKESE